MDRAERESRLQHNATRLEFYLNDCDKRVFNGKGYGIVIVRTPSGDYTVKHIDCKGMAIEFIIAPDGEILMQGAEMADDHGKTLRFQPPMSLDEVLNKVA